jgi:hypothetical protein
MSPPLSNLAIVKEADEIGSALEIVAADFKGVIHDLSAEIYHRIPRVSNSGLSHLLKSPSHYNAWTLQKPEQTAAQELGNLVHLAILEPQKFYLSYAKAPECDRRTKEGKALWESALAKNAGKSLLKQDEFERIEAIMEKVYSHPRASSLLKNGRAEDSFFWEDSELGVACKARADYLRNDGVLIDVKTTESAGHRDFQRAVGTWNYHRQVAFYTDGIAEATGQEIGHCVLMAVEKTYPYEVALYVLDEDAINRGRAQVEKLMDVYAKCVRENSWPGYPSEIQPLCLPEWAS